MVDTLTLYTDLEYNFTCCIFENGIESTCTSDYFIVRSDLHAQFNKEDLAEVPYRKDTLWGVSDIKGKIIVEPKYDSVLMYMDGGYRGSHVQTLPRHSFIIKDKGKYGILTNGEQVVPIKYDYMSYRKGDRGGHIFIAFTKTTNKYVRKMDIFNVSGIKLNKLSVTSFLNARQNFYILSYGAKESPKYDMVELKIGANGSTFKTIFSNCSLIERPDRYGFLLGKPSCKNCYKVIKNGQTTNYIMTFKDGGFVFEKKEEKQETTPEKGSRGEAGSDLRPGKSSGGNSYGNSGNGNGQYARPKSRPREAKAYPRVQQKTYELPENKADEVAKDDRRCYYITGEEGKLGGEVFYWIDGKRFTKNYYHLTTKVRRKGNKYGLLGETLTLPAMFDTIIGYYNSYHRMPVFVLRLTMKKGEVYTAVIQADSTYLIPLTNNFDVQGYLAQKALILIGSDSGIGVVNHFLDTVIEAKYERIVDLSEYQVIAQTDSTFCLYSYYSRTREDAIFKGCFKDQPRKELTTQYMYMRLYEMEDSLGNFLGFAYNNGRKVTYFYED